MNIDGAPTTSVFSLQSPLRKRKIGLGLEIFSEKIGPKGIGGISGSYAYRVPFLQGKLGMGIKLGFLSYHYDWSAIKYKDQNEPYLQSGQDGMSAFDAQAGLYYYTKSFYWGASVTHLTKAQITVNPTDTSAAAHLAPHLFSTIGKGFELDENVVLNPSLYIKMTKAAPVDVDLNVNVQLRQKIWFGVSVRRKYGVVLLTQVQLSEKLKFGYSYDIGMNRIGTIGKATHEIMLGYDMNILKPKTVAPRYL
jgi:type IX secretion system PorP/SprF family membrane protein